MTRLQYIEFAEDGKHPKGYSDTQENKDAGRPIREYFDSPNPTWKNYGAKYPNGFLKLDIDDFDHHSETLDHPIHDEPRSKTIIEALKATETKFLCVRTPHGVHLFFKAPKEMEHRNKQKWMSAIGVVGLEWKFPESGDHICLKRFGDELPIEGETQYFTPCHDKRDIENISLKKRKKIRDYQNYKRSFDELDEVDELPCWLRPIQKSDKKPFNMSFPEGDRTNRLGGYLFYLREQCGFTTDEAFQTVRLMNRFVFENPIPEKALNDEILNDRTYEKLENAECCREHNKKSDSLDTFKDMLCDLGIELQYNETTNCVEFLNLPNEDRFLNVHDQQNLMPVLLQDRYKAYIKRSVTLTTVRGYISFFADQRSYNPIQKFLTATEWDGVDRFPELFTCMGVRDLFDQLLIRKWCYQTAALPFNSLSDAFQAEGVLILQGAQGIGKSRFFHHMAVHEQWFSSLTKSINTNVKDTQIELTSAWITEIGEIDRTFKENKSDVKSFITAPTDTIRRPYAKEFVKRARIASYAGTTNEEKILNTDTGSRRWWIVPIEKIDQVALQKLDLQQFWSQCFHEWKENPLCFRLSDDEKHKLETRNLKFSVLSETTESVIDNLDFDAPITDWKWLTATEILQTYDFPGDTLLSTRTIGITLTNVSKIDDRIRRKGSAKKGRKYFLPPPKND